MNLALSNLRSHRAFTLLEVIVAMAIVGLGVVTLLELFALGLRLTTSSSTRTEAIAFGQQAMDGVLIRPNVEDGEEEGSRGQSYHWRLQVRAVPGDGQPFSQSGWDLKEIALQLKYREGGRERQIEMKTLRLVKKTAR